MFDERVFKKNYDFLEGYREDEVEMLKQEMAKTKDEGRKEDLKKIVVSMVCVVMWGGGITGRELQRHSADEVWRAAIKETATGAERPDGGAGKGA